MLLRLALSASRRSCLRSFSTNTSRPSDAFDSILDGPSLPNDDLVSDDPPTGPPGLLPPGGPSVKPKSKTTNAHNLPKDQRYHLHVFASRNNTILTFTNSLGNTVAWVSAGSCGFKNQQRSLYEAGYQCAVKMFDKVAKMREEKHLVMKLEILFQGFGQGREAVYRALMTTEGDKIRDIVDKLTDTTPLKVGGGTRARKARRL